MGEVVASISLIYNPNVVTKSGQSSDHFHEAVARALGFFIAPGAPERGGLISLSSD
jgi:hypothetical protein